MMKKWLVLVGVFFISFSCTIENLGDPDDASLAGEWVLTNVSCFCAFEEGADFSTTSILVDTDANKVTVQNSGENSYFKASGTYAYTGSGNLLQFSKEDAYTFKVQGDSLQLVFKDDPRIADDEFSYSFRR